MDVLTGVTNGSYNILSGQYCPEKPYIETSTYYQWTYVTTATGVERVRTGINAGPRYIAEYGISDTTWNDWTNSTGWTVWTTLYNTKDGYNTGIELTLVGDENIQMISVQMLDDPNIAAIGDVASGRITTRQFRITGNIYT
jgi:hypothetical protein